MVDPTILKTQAFKLIKGDFQCVIQEGPTNICDICWKFEFRKNVIKLKDTKYEGVFFRNAIPENLYGYVGVATIFYQKREFQCRHRPIIWIFAQNLMS